MKTRDGRQKSGLRLDPNRLDLLGLSRTSLAENWAMHSASPEGHIRNGVKSGTGLLGAPLTIRQVAELIGCSPWTVRQTHVPNGLPYFRSGPNSKLIFYRDQVITWILSQQEKGGLW